MEFWRFIGSDTNLGSPLSGTYNTFLVVLSSLVASLAAYAALSVVARVHASKKRSVKRIWLATGATAMGTGIWAMHFIAMLAFSLPIPVNYNLLITLISAIPAILGSGIALQVMSHTTIKWWRLHLGGLLLAVGIGTMHYTGMEAMRMEALMRYDPKLFGLSILVAYALATAALYIKFIPLNIFSIPLFWLKIGSALIMGNAVAGMHYTAMTAALFYPNPGPSTPVAIFPPLEMGVTITIIVSLTVGLVIIGTMIDGRLAEASESVRESARFSRMLLDSAGEGIIGLDLEGRATFVNPAATGMLGFPVKELITQPLAFLIQHSRSEWHHRFPF